MDDKKINHHHSADTDAAPTPETSTAPPLRGGGDVGVKPRRGGAWLWVPTLYFAEGIPYFVVNNISVTMFTKMGVPNGEMALFTSLLYLPWTLKPLWSPFIDIVKTKRWWILAMQAVMTACLVLLTLTLPHPDASLIAAKQAPVSLFTVTLLLFVITAFASATHDIAADGFYMLANTEEQQSFFVGIRSTFYRLSSIFCQGALVFIAGTLEKSTADIPLAWQITLAITAALFAVITLYHTWALPKEKRQAPPQPFLSREGDADGSLSPSPFGEGRGGATASSGWGGVVLAFFTKPGIWLAIVFMLLYRLPEAFLLKMVNPFLLDPADKGGLALDTDMVGIVYGTVGVIALTVGGIIGGICSSRWGLKRALWPMAACMTLPCATFVYLSMAMPHNLVVISTCVAVEQFGYGFGFTAYMLYMIYVSRGEYATAHYAICTGFMALSMALPGMVAGYLQEAVGYELFFWIVIACCAATIVMTALVDRRIDPTFGRNA